MKKIFILAALSCGSAAFAQVHRMEHRDSTATERTYNLNPIVVTGSGHHQRLKSTATPVRVLSAQEMHEQGISTFDAAITRMMPQVSMAPNSMGTFLRMNGLGNKYILILVNGQRLSGDISSVLRCWTERHRHSMAATPLPVSSTSSPTSPPSS